MLFVKHTLLCFITCLAHTPPVLYTAPYVDFEILEQEVMESRDASDTSEKQQPKAIVYLHSQRDVSFYRDLQTYLAVWETQGQIYWAEQTAIEHADLILLLLSPTFLATKRCQKAMHMALQEREKRGIPVVPVLVRVSNWKESACGMLKALPDNDRPVVEWRQKERAYENICAGLARLLPDLPALGIASPERPRLFQARDLPKGYVPRPQAFNAIKQLLFHREGNQTTAITTALRGAGGFGKTTLALALCHDLEIQAAFPDGILWVELGEHPPRPLDVLNRVVRALEPSLSRAITLEEARESFRTALQERMCLLVIDDVWQTEALKPLLEGGLQCARLVTTRNDLLLPKDATRILVDAMELREAVAVLCQELPEEISQAMYRPRLEALATRLGCWPLLLTLANGMLADLVMEYHLNIDEALATIAEAYQTRGVTAFRLDNLEERQRSVEASLEVSLQHLETFTPPRYHATERYQELAVSPKDIDIPLETLQVYWKGSGGLEAWETKDLCIRLHRLSLLLHCDLGAGTIRLHDVVRSYLIQRAGSHLSALHGRLLDACQQEHGLTRWADLPRSEGYLWQHLILHLCQAGRLDTLKDTFSDLGYLTRKALYTGVSALEADLVLVSIWPPAQADFPLATKLSRSIVRISHLLRKAQTEAEMGSLLLIYLPEDLTTADQRHTLENELPRPFLTAWHRLPRSSSSTLIRTLQGHTWGVNDCAVSPNGQWIVSASEDHTLKIWDAGTGEERLTLSGHTAPVRRCVVGSDSRFIVSASEDHTLKIWDAISGAELRTLTGHTSSVYDCAVSPNGQWIVSACLDKTLKVWDTGTGAELHTLNLHITGLTGCAVSADNRFIISACLDKTLKVWDAGTGAELHTLKGSTFKVWDDFREELHLAVESGAKELPICRVSTDGRFIVSATGDLFESDHTLTIWDAITGTELCTLKGHTGRITGCAVSADSRFVVSASMDGTLKVWDAGTGADLCVLTDHTSIIDGGCAVSPDGRWIISTEIGGALKVWDATTEAELSPHSDHTDPVRRCVVSPDGRFIVSAGGDLFECKDTLRVWDAANGTKRLTLSGHTDTPLDCAVSADSRLIVSTSYDRTLKVWDAITGKERLTLSGHTGPVLGCAVSADSRFIVSASEDHTLKVWDAATGAEQRTLSGHTGPVLGCAVSPDGRVIVSASEDHTLKVWDAATGKEQFTLSGHTKSVEACAYNPDGKWIVSASRDCSLKVWDATTGAELCILKSHTDLVNNCAVSPNGRFIVSTSRDSTLKVWDEQTGQCMLTFPTGGALASCAFHPNGEQLVAGGEHGVYFLRLMM